MKEFWEGLSRPARSGLLAGLVAILAVSGALAWWLLRTDYQALFTDLKPQDASAMLAELEKLKIPHKFDESSASILVDRSQVHSARIKLMGKDIPLQGAVGFELFNNTDFGMTEFAQKINYQRALQGELTRTIQSLSEVREVRVHLALPEQGLFKQAHVRPKAAITLSLKEGQALRAEQVVGIQRLVAAATPGMTAQDVTVVDRQGLALTRSADEVAEGVSPVASSGRLELKKDTEAQLVRKAAAVLDKAFGPGEALASVDVTLNMDQVRVTTEDVLPGASRSSEARGVIVRERDSNREVGTAPLEAARAPNGPAGSNQREVDYQVGKRTEHVISQAGSVRRIQVVAVVRQPLDAAQEEKLKTLIGAAVGVIPERGDAVVVQSMDALAPKATGVADTTSTAVTAGKTTLDGQSESNLSSVIARSKSAIDVVDVLKILVLVSITTLAAFALWLRRRSGSEPPALSEAERQVALRKISAWMSGVADDPVRAGAAQGELRP